MKNFSRIHRLLSLITATMLFSLLIIPALAVEEDNVGTRIHRTEIEELYRASIDSQSATNMQSFSSIEMTDEMRNTFFETIYRISELKAEKAWASENSVFASSFARNNLSTDQEIEQLYSIIDSLPVVKMDYSDIARLTGAHPSVPSDTSYVHFYGMTSYIVISGIEYEIFEIIAYSDIATSGANRPMYAFNDSLQLLGSDTYTQNQFCKIIKFVIDNTVAAAIDAQIPGSSILYSIADPLSFFSPTSSRSLEMKYKANSYFDYAYVSKSGSDWYDFMQTTEQMKIDATTIAYSPNYIPHDKDDGVTRKVAYLEGPHWADVTRPATRYANGIVSHESFPLGTKRIYRDNIHKETIPLTYYIRPEAIPGV